MSVPESVARPQLAEDVARIVRKRIFDGTYAAGTYVRLDQLAADLGISVTPVREALFELKAEGLLAQQPHRGFVVLPVTGRDLTDVSDVQAYIGGELARARSRDVGDTNYANFDGSSPTWKTPTPPMTTNARCRSTTSFRTRSTSPRILRSSPS